MKVNMRLFKATVEFDFYFYDEGVNMNGENKDVGELLEIASLLLDDVLWDLTMEDHISDVGLITNFKTIPLVQIDEIPYGMRYYDQDGKECTIERFIEKNTPPEQVVDRNQIRLI